MPDPAKNRAPNRPSDAPLPPEAAPDHAAPRILALVSDLMLSLQLEAPAHVAGYALALVPDLAALPVALAEHAPQLVILDLTDRAFPFAEAFALIRGADPKTRVLAFFPHVRRELGAMAESAGCDIVMPRSRFLTDLPRSLRDALAPVASQ